MNKLPGLVASTLVSMLLATCLSTAAFADPGMPPPPPGPPPPADGMNPPPPPPGGHAPSPEMFQKLKARMLGNQQQRIQILQQATSCMQAATTMEQLKACHEKEHQALTQMQQMRPPRPQDRK